MLISEKAPAGRVGHSVNRPESARVFLCSDLVFGHLEIDDSQCRCILGVREGPRDLQYLCRARDLLAEALA
jgi:hypothetical protein